MKILFFFIGLFCSKIILCQIEPSILDGVYIQEHIPTTNSLKSRSLLYIEELKNEKARDSIISFDSLQLHYSHSSYGIIFKDTVLSISKDHFIISNLQQSNLFMRRLAYRYNLVLANFCDRIVIEQGGEEVFEIRYYNFIAGSASRSYFLFDELLDYMNHLRNVTSKLDKPIFPEFNTD